MILVHDEIDTKLDELEPLIVRGQFNQAITELQKIFEQHVEAGELDEARLLVGLANRAKSRDL
jgi:hypothetical protein